MHREQATSIRAQHEIRIVLGVWIHRDGRELTIGRCHGIRVEAVLWCGDQVVVIDLEHNNRVLFHNDDAVAAAGKARQQCIVGQLGIHLLLRDRVQQDGASSLDEQNLLRVMELDNGRCGGGVQSDGIEHGDTGRGLNLKLVRRLLTVALDEPDGTILRNVSNHQRGRRATDAIDARDGIRGLV